MSEHIKTHDGYDVRVPSNGQVNLNTVLGALGTAGFAGINLQSLLGGVLGGGANNPATMMALASMLNQPQQHCGCSEDHWVNRDELSMQKELTNRDMEIAYLRSRDAAKTDSLELYRYIDGKIAGIESQLCEQKVFNATQIGTISCIQGQIAQLMALTKTVIPAANVCPAPMPQYNSWTAPTAPATGG